MAQPEPGEYPSAQVRSCLDALPVRRLSLLGQSHASRYEQQNSETIEQAYPRGYSRSRCTNKPRARLEKGLCGAIFKARVTRRYEGGIVTDHLAEKLIQFPNQGMIRVAQGIFRRPVLAGGVYLLALLGVLSSPFGRSRPAPHVVHYEAEGEPSAVGALGSPDASVLREIEGAGLRVIERAFEPG